MKVFDLNDLATVRGLDELANPFPGSLATICCGSLILQQKGHSHQVMRHIRIVHISTWTGW